jgi:hypothetical protein
MSDADREWTSLLDYDETSVKMWGPTATDPTTVEQEWRGDRGGRRANSGGSHAEADRHASIVSTADLLHGRPVRPGLIICDHRLR